MRPPISRDESVSRRAMLRGAFGLGVAALVPGVACGNNDAEVFGAGTIPPNNAPEGSSTTSSTVTATTGGATSDGVPLGSELVVAFTYQQAGGGKNEPPYLAVWVENAAGELVQTIELWYLQSARGTRWLPDLKRWFAVDDDRIEAGGTNTVDVVSSATRLPGSYSVAWDGSVEGRQIPGGDYFLCIESVREDGPYSLIRESIVLDGESFSRPLASDGELVDARVDLVV